MSQAYRIIFTLIISAVAALSAEAAVKISGIITDENNEPLEFATIRIKGTALGTTSGLDGKYIQLFRRTEP